MPFIYTVCIFLHKFVRFYCLVINVIIFMGEGTVYIYHSCCLTTTAKKKKKAPATLSVPSYYSFCIVCFSTEIYLFELHILNLVGRGSY